MVFILSLVLIIFAVIGFIAALVFKHLYNILKELDVASEAIYATRVINPVLVMVWIMIHLTTFCLGPVYWLALWLFIRHLIAKTSPPMALRVFFIYLGLTLCAFTLVGAVGGLIIALFARQSEVDRRFRIITLPDNSAAYRY